jgi:hypothetical protein
MHPVARVSEHRHLLRTEVSTILVDIGMSLIEVPAWKIPDISRSGNSFPRYQCMICPFRCKSILTLEMTEFHYDLTISVDGSGYATL